jgi:hypothetical protein
MLTEKPQSMDKPAKKALLLAENNTNNIRLQHLVTTGAKYMLVQEGIGILAWENLNV